MLGSTSGSLVQTFDLSMLDLDGVVYRGDAPVPGAAQALAAVRDTGHRCAFVTNNAARSAHDVAAKLTRLGVPAAESDVVTSAQAAARLLADLLPAGSTVAVLGSDALADCVAAVGLVPVALPSGAARPGEAGCPDAMVSGFGPSVPWRDVIRAAVLVRDGVPWVASNTDLTFPTDYGIAPGHGELVRMIRDYSGVTPRVAGKPEPPLLHETTRRTGASRPLMVGDRLDTDILGAHRAGVPSLLVLTGVTGLEELVAAAPQYRPTYLAPTLHGLLDTMRAPEVLGGSKVRHGRWLAEVRAGRLEVGSTPDGGQEDGSRDRAGDWWRAVATSAWLHLDEHGTCADTSALHPPVHGGA